MSPLVNLHTHIQKAKKHTAETDLVHLVQEAHLTLGLTLGHTLLVAIL